MANKSALPAITLCSLQKCSASATEQSQSGTLCALYPVDVHTVTTGIIRQPLTNQCASVPKGGFGTLACSHTRAPKQSHLPRNLWNTVYRLPPSQTICPHKVASLVWSGSVTPDRTEMTSTRGGLPGVTAGDTWPWGRGQVSMPRQPWEAGAPYTQGRARPIQTSDLEGSCRSQAQALRRCKERPQEASGDHRK